MSTSIDTSVVRPGMEVGCEYRWPYDHGHPDCWQPPIKGIVLEQHDPHAWQGSLAFPCHDGSLPDADKVKAHVEWCHSEGLLLDKVPVLYEEVDASGPFLQWDSKLLPYAEMFKQWEVARAKKYQTLERQRRERIKELRAEIRKVKTEMKAAGVKRVSCFNRLEYPAYQYNATMFRLETDLKTLTRKNEQ